MLTARIPVVGRFCAMAIVLSSATAAFAQTQPQPRATMTNLPHATADGLKVVPAEGNSLMGIFALGGHEIRFQVHEGFVPSADALAGADGVTAASLGGCVIDEADLLLSGWGVDADNQSYAQLPQVLHDGLISADSSTEDKISALADWCAQRTSLVDGFVALMRALEFERTTEQQALFQGRYPAWQLALSQARNLQALCLFAGAEAGHAPKAAEFSEGF